MGKPVLAVDIGGVIKDSGYLTGVVPKSMESLKNLKAAGIFENIYLISQCWTPLRKLAFWWLTRHNFWDITGISLEDVRFCNWGSTKAWHAEDLGITHFVDDRPDLLVMMQSSVSHCFLFGGSYRSNGLPKRLTHVSDWDELYQELMKAPP